MVRNKTHEAVKRELSIEVSKSSGLTTRNEKLNAINTRLTRENKRLTLEHAKMARRLPQNYKGE